MKKSRFTEEPIVAALREADRTSVAEVAKQHRVSEQTLYVWHKRFGVKVWAKCDMVYTLAHSRLSPWWKEKGGEGKRVYLPILLPDEELTSIRRCLLHAVGLAALTGHL